MNTTSLIAFRLASIEPIIRFPKVSDGIIKIFAQFAPNELKASSFNMKAAIIDFKIARDNVQNAHEKIQNEERKIEFHKRASVILLAASVVCIAVGILLANLVSPLLLMISLTAAIPVIAMVLLQLKTGRPVVPAYNENRNYLVFNIILSGLLYVFDAFTRKVPEKRDFLRQMTKAVQQVSHIHERLKSISQNKDLILNGIKEALKAEKISPRQKKILLEAKKKLNQITWYFEVCKLLPLELPKV